MLDIKFLRDNPDIVKQNIKNKFQDEKLPLVDQVIDLYNQSLDAKQRAETLQANRNTLSKQIGVLKGQAKKNPDQAAECEEKIAAITAQVNEEAEERKVLEDKADELSRKVREIMLTIPNIIDPSVPIGPDDSCNVEVQRFGERPPRLRQRILLPPGRHCPAPRGSAGLRKRLYDRPGLYLCHSSLYDPRRRGRGRHVLP